MADRIVVMSDGNVEQIGTPLEIYDNPANTFVASFIGSPGINLIDGVVRSDADGAAVEMAGGVRLPLPAGAAVSEGEHITYGVRPEHLTLGQGGFESAVELIEPTGAETLVFTRIGDAELCARAMERQTVRRGDIIGFSPKLDKVLIFDAETGVRR